VTEPAACPGCGSGDFRTLFQATDRLYRTTSKPFFVVECSECGLIRLHPRPKPTELRTYYPGNYWFAPEAAAADRLEEAYRRFVLRDHLGFVSRALASAGESGPVVDVGCGGGLLLRMLAERGVPVLGLDLSPRAASVAWRRNGVPAASASLRAVPLPHNSCAAVTMFHVLEHLENPAEYLAAARDLLRPNGRLVVQVPNAASWQFLLFGENWSGIDVPRHLLNFRACDLEALLDFCGFEVLRCKHFSLRDNPAGFATSVAPGLDPMARRIRKVAESPGLRMLKDLVYFALAAAAVPFTLLEACCRSGSTIMMEARKKP
jgi:SAM-dependent methyltransferase